MPCGAGLCWAATAFDAKTAEARPIGPAGVQFLGVRGATTARGAGSQFAAPNSQSGHDAASEKTFESRRLIGQSKLRIGANSHDGAAAGHAIFACNAAVAQPANAARADQLSFKIVNFILIRGEKNEKDDFSGLGRCRSDSHA